MNSITEKKYPRVRLYIRFEGWADRFLSFGVVIGNKAKQFLSLVLNFNKLLITTKINKHGFGHIES